jgi:acyl-coenzyme A thioesterase PaaI-like protein
MAKRDVVVLLLFSSASSKRKRSMAMAALSVAEAEQLLHSSVPPWMLALQLQVRATTAESATLVMPFDEQLLRPGRIIAGQALMALADTAMVLALWSALGAFRPVVTIDMTTTYG